MSGKKLLRDVGEATGLPDQLISDELESLVTGSGLSVQDLSLDQLRQVLADYLQDVFIEAKNEFEA